MESILFSLNSVMPLFLMGIAGYLLVQRGVVNENFVDQASNLCFKLLIPFSLFREVYDAKVLDSFDFRLPLYCMLSVLTVLILAWLIWPHFVKDRARCGACIHSTFRANVVLMGIPVLTNIYGEEGALVASILMIPGVFLSVRKCLNGEWFGAVGGAVTVFTAFAPESSGARLDPRKLLLSIAKNPFIIAILLGLAAQLSGISFPPFASKSIDYLADMSTPLALLAVGGQFDPKKAAGNLRLNLTICTLRLVVIPAVVIAVAAALGFRGPELAFIFVVVGSPSAVSGAALAKVMGSDHQLTGEVTLMTSLLSAFTFFIAFTLLRSVALI